MAATDARGKLLDAAIDYVGANGLTDLSLRKLAGELGTSHRMLIHHFGSKDDLWVAIVREVERRQREGVAGLVIDPSLSFADAQRVWWKHISDPSLWPNERLFFEVYCQGLHGRAPAADLLEGDIASWVEPTAALAQATGLDRDTAYAFARLGIAVTRGLLLDLLSTGDREGVDAAMEHWIAVNAPLFEAAAGR